jgi:hypothetical protein
MVTHPSPIRAECYLTLTQGCQMVDFRIWVNFGGP